MGTGEMERKEGWEYGNHGPDDPGNATLVDTVTPYDPTLQWETLREPTIAWTAQTVEEPTPYWRHGLAVAGVLAAVTAGFFLGRGATAPEKAPLPNVPQSSAAAPVPTGPAPSVPVVLPQPPDLPPAISPAPSLQARSYSLPAPPPHMAAPAPQRRMPPPPATVARRAVPPQSKPQTAQHPVRPEAPMPPPVHLYGVRRPETPRVVASWQARLPSVETSRSF